MAAVQTVPKSGGWVLSNLWNANAARCQARIADTVRILFVVTAA